MEVYLIIMLILMILGSIYSLHAKDLLSAVVAYGIVGFGLVISFLLLYAPDLAIVQVVVEIITLIIMIAVITNATHQEERRDISLSSFFYLAVTVLFAAVFFIVFVRMSGVLSYFGQHTMRMAQIYIDNIYEAGSANIVTGILFHFRAYDTLGEATVLFTAVVGVISILRHYGKKGDKAER